MQCLTNNEGMVYGQGWCIGSWVGVIDSLSVGLKITTLLISATSNYNTLLNHRDTLKDLSLCFREKWIFYLDMFLGKRSGLIGIFCGVYPESIAWESMAKPVSEITTTTSKSNTNIQVKTKPIRMDYQMNDNECSTTTPAVLRQSNIRQK